MNKRITSILLCFVMLLSMLVSAAPAYAAPENPPMVFIEADRTEANPGDTITYKFYLQQPDTMTAFAFNMVAPDGLTYVEDSGTLGSTASAAWGSTFEWVPEADLQLQWYSSSGDDVTDTSKIELITIKFKVADDATIGAEYELSLTNMQLAAGSTQNYDDISSTVEVSTEKVKIVAKPVAVTGVTIDETLSVKTGESKTPSYTVNPAEATNKAVSFKSDNPAVATVNETTGEVTGVKEGTATITITTADGNFTDTCVVTVACSHANRIPVAEKASDCKDQGWDAYVKCDDCGQLFDVDAKTEIAEIPLRPLTSNHTGGTPTCTAQAVCTVCSQPYGDMLDHDFTKEEKKAEALKTAGDCVKEAVYFKSCSACGKVDTDENNTFLGEKDPDNHANYGTYLDGVVAVDHKNGVDGYTGDKKCNECDALIEKGEAILAGAHVPAEDWSTDSTHHWKECTVVGCGIVIDGSKAEHISEKPENKAACGKQAVCDVCGVSYGNPISHSFTKEEKKETALKTAGDCVKEAVYIKSCVHCGQVDTDENNTFLGEKDPDNHANYGTYLDGVVAVDHKNGVDGYTGDKKCNECDALIEKGEAILAGAHVPAEDWSTDSTHHWKECTVVGCGIVIDGSKAEHSSTGANVATCQKAAVCDVCGVSYGTVADHDWNTTAWEKDATGHWHKCNTAGCTEKNAFAAHTPDHEGGATEEYAIKCSVCGYEIEAQLQHTHVFDKEVAEDRYLASKATCTDPAKYYKSCKCGEKGTETFTYGSATGHNYGTDWKSDKDNHWNECACGDKANTAAHKDDNKDGKCDVCGHNVPLPGSDNPATGDNTFLYVLAVILCACIFGAVSYTVIVRKRSFSRV